MRWLWIAAAVLGGSAALEWLAGRRSARRFPPPGRLISAGIRKLHLQESGDTGVTVVFEAGLAATSLSWSLVQPEGARFAHAVSYDRAGLGWSSAATVPLTLAGMLDDLALVVSVVSQRADRVILVGHSFGGLLALAFAARHPERVAGLVLIDPVSLAHWGACRAPEHRRLAMGARLSRRGAWLARFGIVRLCLAVLATGRTTLPNLVAKMTGGPGRGLVARLTGEMSRLPRALWPVVVSHWSRAGSFRTMADYLEALPRLCADSTILPPASIPITVLSAGTATAAELREREQWVTRSERGRHLRLEDCSHWIQLQNPRAVVAAVRELAV